MSNKTLFIYVAIMIVAGLAVLMIFPNYRIEKNLLSNKDYYSTVGDDSKSASTVNQSNQEEEEAETIKDLFQRDKSEF